MRQISDKHNKSEDQLLHVNTNKHKHLHMCGLRCVWCACMHGIVFYFLENLQSLYRIILHVLQLTLVASIQTWLLSCLH